ncbi:MAG: acyl-coenzyme A thioesterase PaaI-like protein [Limisphaerales bacterium]|jgi:acyl-coenzyme A thioesterase PaaI-like protein
MNSNPSPSFHQLFSSPEFQEHFTKRAGAHADIGIEFVEADQAVCMRIPFAEKLIRATTNRSIHAGAVMTALDSAMGLAVMMNMTEPSSLATLELRYDEIRCPNADSSIEVRAECEHITNDIAYLVATAQESGSSSPFARAIGRFILTGAPSGFLEQALQMMESETLGQGVE